MNSGTLYIVATPIGNLEDLTFRASRILSEVTVIYAEDTRVSRKLLDRYKITTPLRSYREAAPSDQVEQTLQQIITTLQSGNSVAYVSDAGTPGVSDPGCYLVKRISAVGCVIVPIPGASALPVLLSMCGLSIQRPLFVGFLPKKKGHQTLMRQLHQAIINGIVDGILFYESPERIVKLLGELSNWGIPLQVCMVRELTKIHEEIIRDSLEGLIITLSKRSNIKGEISLVISPNPL